MSPSPQDWLAVEKQCKQVLAAADWQALGELYFHEDGEREWRERRKPVVELGLQLARRLARQVEPGGVSLWVGAGVAELPVLLAESLLLQRTVVACNLLARECEVLNAALAAAAPDASVLYQAGDVREVVGDRRFDQLGCISLFTDPETWPMLSGVTYGRLAPVQVDVDAFVAEREQARELAATLFERLDVPAVITTTFEEASWFLEQAERRGGLVVDAEDELVETAVVGDPVGFLRVRPG